MKYLAACATVKNEASIIIEWMAFHRAAGVEHFIIIDNGSTDNTADLIHRFKDQQSVTYLRRPETIGQVTMFMDAAKQFQDKFEWIAFIDADEFLFCADGGDLRTKLSVFNDAAAVCVYWLLYGSSGFMDCPPGLAIENFHLRAPDDFFVNRHVKSIVRPRHIVGPLTSHIFELNGPMVDECGNVLVKTDPPGYFGNTTAIHNVFHLNHYHIRSQNVYKEKIMRGYFGDDSYKLAEEEFRRKLEMHDRNEVLDQSALNYRNLMEFYM